jgi:hypothetical protein
MHPRDHVVPIGVAIAEASPGARVDELIAAMTDRQGGDSPSTTCGPAFQANTRLAGDSSEKAQTGESTPAPVSFPVAAGDQAIVDYWHENLRPMRAWVIELLGTIRPAIEDAYMMAEWHSTHEARRPIRWYEKSLMFAAVRDVLNARDAILQRAP